MKLTKYEQSGFVLETSNGYRFGWDIGTRTPLEKCENIKPLDAFMVSHIHGDHFSPEHINTLEPKKLFLNAECTSADSAETIIPEVARVKIGDTVRIEGIKVKIFEVDHGPNVTQPNENMGFLVEADGETVYFGGDMFSPSGISVEDLMVDVALIPVGTYYTFGPKEAFDFAKKFKKIGKVIPIHYSPNDHIYAETRDEFILLASSEFTVDQVNLP